MAGAGSVSSHSFRCAECYEGLKTERERFSISRDDPVSDFFFGCRLPSGCEPFDQMKRTKDGARRRKGGRPYLGSVGTKACLPLEPRPTGLNLDNKLGSARLLCIALSYCVYVNAGIGAILTGRRELAEVPPFFFSFFCPSRTIPGDGRRRRPTSFRIRYTRLRNEFI